TSARRIMPRVYQPPHRRSIDRGPSRPLWPGEAGPFPPPRAAPRGPAPMSSWSCSRPRAQMSIEAQDSVIQRLAREQVGAELVGGRRAHLELEQAADLDLADPLARQVHDLADLLERDPAALGDVERTGVLELPWLEVGEVDLDRSSLGVDVEIEVM